MSLVTIPNESCSMGMAQGSVLEQLSERWMQMDREEGGGCSVGMWFRPQAPAPFSCVASLALFL